MKKETGIENAENTENVPSEEEPQERTAGTRLEKLIELRGTVEWEGDLESWRETRIQKSPA